MCLEATLRLLRPPRGFEGFGAVAVDLDTRDLAVADGRDMSYLRFHGEPASPASAPLPVQRHDTTVGSSQNLVNSDFVVIQDGEEVVEVALDGLGPAIFRTRANRDSGSYPRRLGVALAKDARQVAAKPRIPSSPHYLHVLLRHRPPVSRSHYSA